MNFSVTRLYREQHDRLRAHAGTMLQATTSEEHKLLLARLAGSLRMHLKGEDDGLYPYLLAHADPAVRAKAAEFQPTMGDLAAKFDAFYSHWIKTGAIAADTSGYVAQLRAIIEALAQRMELEDRELYALADHIAAA